MDKRVLILLVLSVVMLSSCSNNIEETDNIVVEEEIEAETEVEETAVEVSEELPFQDKIVNEKKKALIAFTNSDNELIIYDTYSEEEVASFSNKYDSKFWIVGFSPNGKKIGAHLISDKSLYKEFVVIDIESEEVEYLGIYAKQNSWGWYGNDKLVGVCDDSSANGQVCIIDIENGKVEYLDLIKGATTGLYLISSNYMSVSDNGKIAFLGTGTSSSIHESALFISTQDSKYERYMDLSYIDTPMYGRPIWVGESLYLVRREGGHYSFTGATLISVLNEKEIPLEINADLNYMSTNWEGYDIINHYSESENKFAAIASYFKPGRYFIVYFDLDGSYELYPIDFPRTDIGYSIYLSEKIDDVYFE